MYAVIYCFSRVKCSINVYNFEVCSKIKFYLVNAGTVRLHVFNFFNYPGQEGCTDRRNRKMIKLEPELTSDKGTPQIWSSFNAESFLIILLRFLQKQQSWIFLTLLIWWSV